jgi:hypothetical protein
MIKSPDIKFNGKGEGVKSFIQRIKEHSAMGGIQTIFAVPDPITRNLCDFLNNYGVISMLDCNKHMSEIYTAGQAMPKMIK